MISSMDLQNIYFKLYNELRKWIWGVEDVRKIANLEVSIFDTFPSIPDIQSNLDKVKLMVKPIKNDEAPELFQYLHELQSKLDEADDIYAQVDKVQEVISK